MTTSRLYYECHVTLDPVPEVVRDYVTNICSRYGFKLAKLLMQKGGPSDIDTFCTAHDTEYEPLLVNMIKLIKALQRLGYTVRRYKIEDTLLDSRPEKDPLGLLAD